MITMAVAAGVSVAVAVTIAGRSPPATMVGITPPSDADVEPTVAEAETEAPTGEGIVVDAEAPGDRPGVVVVVVPGVVVVARSVDHASAIHIRSDVARCVAHVHHIGGGVVDVDVLDVVGGVVGGNGLDILGDLVADRPGTLGSVRHEPDGIVTAVVPVVDEEHRLVGVHRILHVGVADRLELRIAVVFDGEGGFLAVDLGGLGNVGLQDRLTGLRRAGHVGPDLGHVTVGGDGDEAGGQIVVGDVLPRSLLQRRGTVPPSGQQHVVELAVDVHEDVTLGVVQVEKAGLLDGGPRRIAIDLDEFGRNGGDDDVGNDVLVFLGWFCGVLAFSTLCCSRIHASFRLRPGLFLPLLLFFGCDLVGDGLDGGRQLGRHLPALQDLLGAVPVFTALEEVFLRGGIFDDEVGSVDHPFQAGVLQIGEDGIAVDEDEDRGGVGDDDPGWFGVQLIGGLLPLLDDLHARQKAVDGHLHVPLGNLAFEIAAERIHLVLGRVGELGLGDRQFPEGRRARVHVRVETAVEPHGAEDRGLVSLGIHLDRGARFELVAAVRLQLGLVDDDAALLSFELQGPA